MRQEDECVSNNDSKFMTERSNSFQYAPKSRPRRVALRSTLLGADKMVEMNTVKRFARSTAKVGNLKNVMSDVGFHRVLSSRSRTIEDGYHVL